MGKSVLYRSLLVACGMLASAPANAFAVFTVPFGTPVVTGQVIGVGVIVPSAIGQGVPVTWKQTGVNITVAFAPDPPAPLLNGTTTWNENAIAAMADWNSVGANISFIGAVGGGDPCVTDGNVVAAFDPSVCLGILPAFALGLTRLVAIVDSPSSIRISDADIAIIPPNDVSASGAFISDAFDSPVAFPAFDFRRIMLHEYGHAIGLAHPDDVFGVTPAIQSTVMYSQSVAARLTADDRNGALALYPAPASSGSVSPGGGGGGGSSGLLLAVLLGALTVLRPVYSRVRSRAAYSGARRGRDGV